MNLIKKATESLDINLQGKFLEFEKLTKEEHKEHRELIFELQGDFQKMCQLGKDWPSGRAVFFNTKKNFVIKVNNEDQLEIQYSEDETNIDKFLTNLINISNKLNEIIPFSEDDNFGFVTTLPENLGTTLKAEVTLKAPNLVKARNLSEL
jgi:protein-arginine kinase